MKGYICARFGEFLQKTAAATALFAILTTLFLFSPAHSESSKNPGKNSTEPQTAQPPVSSGLVISQFQGAGGTQNDEFIELHNKSSNQVDLNGLRVVYRSSSGTDDVLIAEWTVSTIIPAGGYYLIASDAYDGAVTPDFIYNNTTCRCALSATSGGIAIRSGALNTGEIIDSVGYGGATNVFVETAATGAPAVNGSQARNNAGCADTDNNSADFSALNPSAPRNTATAVNICPATLSINNVTMTEGDGGTKTFTFTVSLSAPAGAGGVTFDIATADGTATTAGNDYVARSLTNQTIAEGSQKYSFDVTVIGDTAIEPTETFSVNITNVTGAPVADATGVGTITTDDAALSATGTSTPSTVQAGNTTLLKVTVTPATNPPSSGITVTGNLSGIGGSATQTFFDNGTNGDATANDNVFSYLATVAAGTPNGAKSLPITVTDAQGGSANTTIGLTVGTFASSNVHLTMGNPSNATTDVNNPFNYLLLKDQYAMSYHRDRAIPNWVSWHLDSTWLGNINRQGDFRPDPTLPAGWYQVTNESYSGSGFNRGHHTPSGDRTSSVVHNSATFLMTNIMPQAGGNNQGPWEKLESYSRTLVGDGNELYTIAGSFGTGGTGDNGFATTIDGGRVTVPAQTWKVIIILPVGDNDAARVNNNTRTIGVIMPNVNSILGDSWQKYITTVDQVEALTGYDFFSNVDPAIQEVIESRLFSENNTTPYSISGVVNYGTTPSGDPAKFVPDVTLTASGTPQATDTTDASGAYSLDGLGAGAYTVTPSKAAQTNNNGISLQDASEVAKYVFNQRTFTPNQLIAADATGDGTVSLQDASEIAKRAFNVASSNIIGQWKFVPAFRNYPSLSSNQTGQNYEAVLVGDVTGSWTPPQPPTNRPEEETAAKDEIAGNEKNEKAKLIVRDWQQAKGVQSNAGKSQQFKPGGNELTAIWAGENLPGQSRESRAAETDIFGYYPSKDVRTGKSYTNGADEKQYRFGLQTLTVNESLSEANAGILEPIWSFKLFQQKQM